MPDNNTDLNGTNGSAPTANQQQNRIESRLQAIQQLIFNQTSMRSQWFRQMLDPRRDIDDECGYPRTSSPVNIEIYRQLYDREAIAARVVNVLPEESWQVTPLVYEDQDTETVTPFEEAWDSLGGELSSCGGKSWYCSEEGSPIWEYLCRVDKLSGIGAFGLILIGIDDGKSLDQPVDGAMTLNTNKTVPILNAQRVQVGVKVIRGQTKTTIVDSYLHPNEQKALEDDATFTRYVQNVDNRSSDRDDHGERPAAKYVTNSLNDNEKQVLKQWIFEREALTSNDAANSPFMGSSRAKDSKGREVFDIAKPENDMYSGIDAFQGGPSEYLADKPSKKQRKLIYLRVFDESLIQIVRYEWNPANPRFGMPVMYRITLNDPRDQHSGIGLPLSTVFVHWTRVIHIADNLGSSEIFGNPRMKDVLNRILDLRKIYSSDGEAYWRNAILKLFFESHPQLGPDVDINYTELKNDIEQMMNGIQQWMVSTGLSAKSIPPAVVDPTAHINVQIEAICIAKGIPVPVFKGYEIGEQASTNNDDDWHSRIKKRQVRYLTPKVIVPLVDRLIILGVLPEPCEYMVEWPDLNELSAERKAAIAVQFATALSTYLSGGLENLIQPRDFLVHFLYLSEEQADAMIEASMKAQEEKMTQQQEAGMLDEFGNPIAQQPEIDQETGKPTGLDVDGMPMKPPQEQPKPIFSQKTVKGASSSSSKEETDDEE